MLYDKQNNFSNDQAITASAISENVIEVGPGDYGSGSDMLIDVIVTEAFDNLTTLQVELRTDDDVAFGSPTTLYQTTAVPLADLAVGYKFKIKGIPAGCEDYLALYYTVVGTAPTTGKIEANMTPMTEDRNYDF